MNILIATGIYPPMLGGPAKYALNLALEWRKMGHNVDVRHYDFESRLPTGLRHFFYFIKIIPAVRRSHFILALDTFSAGFPALIAAKLFGRKIILRTGGDFLWEFYVERTNDLVLLRDFYSTRLDHLNLKEKTIFKITKFVLRNVSALVFSTAWQRDIFCPAYKIDKNEIYIIENYYGHKVGSFEPEKKNFISATRRLKWKNFDRLSRAFDLARVENKEISLDNEIVPLDEFTKKIQSCYAVILVSLGDISPNMILESIQANKPFILTRETGLYDKLKSIAIFVDPEDEGEIKEKILWLSNESNYQSQVEKIRNFNFDHSWEEIGEEFLKAYGEI